MKSPIALPANRAEAASIMIELAVLANHRRELQAEIDAGILALRNAGAPCLAGIDAAIDRRMEQLHVWAQANPGEFEPGHKSIEFASGALGFRTSPPKLALLRSWTWDNVLAALKAQPLYEKFVRKKEEVDKAGILAQAQAGFSPVDLSIIGVKVTRDETFFADPKLTQ